MKRITPHPAHASLSISLSVLLSLFLSLSLSLSFSMDQWRFRLTVTINMCTGRVMLGRSVLSLCQPRKHRHTLCALICCQYAIKRDSERDEGREALWMPQLWRCGGGGGGGGEEERGHPQTNDLERHQSARPRQPRQMRRREAGRQEFMDSNTGEESAGRQLCSGGGAEGGGGGGGGGCVRLAAR